MKNLKIPLDKVVQITQLQPEEITEDIINQINELYDSISSEVIADEKSKRLAAQKKQKAAEKKKKEEEEKKRAATEEIERAKSLAVNEYGFIQVTSPYDGVEFKASAKIPELTGLDRSHSVVALDISSKLESDLSGLKKFSFESVIMLKDNSVRTLTLSKTDRSLLSTLLYSKEVRTGLMSIFIDRPDFIANLVKQIFSARNSVIRIRAAQVGYNWLSAALDNTLDLYGSKTFVNEYGNYIFSHSVNPVAILTKDTKLAMLTFMYHFLLDNGLLTENIVLDHVKDLNSLNIDDSIVKYGLESKTLGIELTKIQLDNIISNFKFPRLEDDMPVVTLADSFLTAVTDLRNQFDTVTQIVNSYNVVLPLVRALVLDDYSSFDLAEIAEIKNSTNLKVISSVLNIALDSLKAETIRPVIPGERWYAYIDLIYDLLFTSKSHFFRIVSKHEFLSHFNVNVVSDDLNFKKFTVISAKYASLRPIQFYFNHMYGRYMKLEEFKDLDNLTSDISYFLQRVEDMISNENITTVIKQFVSGDCVETVAFTNVTQEQKELLSYCLAETLYVSSTTDKIYSYISQDNCKVVDSLKSVTGGVIISDVETNIFLLAKDMSAKYSFPLHRLPKVDTKNYQDYDSYKGFFKKGLYSKTAVRLFFLNQNGKEMRIKNVDFTFGDAFLSHISGRNLYVLRDNDHKDCISQLLKLKSYYMDIANALFGANTDVVYDQFVSRFFVVQTLQAIMTLSNNMLIQSMRIFNEHNIFNELNKEFANIRAKQNRGEQLSTDEVNKIKASSFARSLQNDHRNKLLSAVSNTLSLLEIFSLVDNTDSVSYMASVIDYLSKNYSPDIVELIKNNKSIIK